MGTTTVRLDDDLKARVAAAAERSGRTAHAFILDAIAQTLAQVEEQEAFHRLAGERWSNLLQTGKTVPWDEAKSYLVARASGAPARKPAARKPRR